MRCSPRAPTPHRLGRDRLHARVGVQRHQDIPRHPRLAAGLWRVSRDDPDPSLYATSQADAVIEYMTAHSTVLTENRLHEPVRKV